MGFNNWNLWNSRFQQEGGFDPTHYVLTYCIEMREINQNHPSVKASCQLLAASSTGKLPRESRSAQERCISWPPRYDWNIVESGVKPYINKQTTKWSEDGYEFQKCCWTLHDNHHLLQQTIFGRTAALNPTRDGPMGQGFDRGDGSCIDWHQRHVVRVFSALCHLVV